MVEIYTDYASVIATAHSTYWKDILTTAEALGIIYLLLLPVAWSLSYTLERQKLVHRSALIQGRDQRLNDARGAVERAGIAPALQLVRQRQMPVTVERRLSVVQTQMRAEPHLLKPVGKAQIGRRVVHRIAAEDQQRVDRPGVVIAAQRGERFAAGIRIGHIWIDKVDRLADVAEL